jgi:hypothetical protein
MISLIHAINNGNLFSVTVETGMPAEAYVALTAVHSLTTTRHSYDYHNIVSQHPVSRS